jgi:hypothetical protein
VLDPLNLSSASFSLLPSIYDNSKKKGHTVNGIPNNFPKHGMFIRQFIRFIQCKEELRGICIPLAGICHSYETTSVGQLDFLLILSLLLHPPAQNVRTFPSSRLSRITPHSLLDYPIFCSSQFHSIAPLNLFLPLKPYPAVIQIQTSLRSASRTYRLNLNLPCFSSANGSP